MHVWRIQEGYLQHSIGVITFLDKALQKPRKMGYQRNEYDRCVITKIVHNKKCTILWNVDDLNMSHFDPDIISSILADIDTEYGNITKTTITRGKIYKYFGMTIDYSSPSKLIFSVVNYIGKILNDTP